MSSQKRERPVSLPGTTVRVRTGHGNLYVTVNTDADGLFEVFATVGKAGSTEAAYLQAITKLVTMALRAGICPELVIKELRGIVDVPTWDNGKQVLSVPDGIAQVMQQHVGGISVPKAVLTAVEEGKAFAVQCDTPEQAEALATEACPECGSPIVFEEGCKHCRECGWSKC